MAVTTTLAACSTNPALNGPDGSDLPSTLDDAIRYALSFIAQLRDGAGVAVGTMVRAPSLNAPPGYLKMNGQLVSRTTYPALWAFAAASGCITSDAIWGAGTWFGQFSTGDGVSNFRLPDLRGIFLRTLDESRGYDPGRGIGAFQDHDNVIHNHGYSDPAHVHGVSDPGHTHGASADVQGSHSHSYQASVNLVATAGGAAPAAQVTGPSGTSTDGAHGHNISVAGSFTGIGINAAGIGITILNAGGADGRPRNVAYPYYIKY
ncbi:phage tail protein [Variovorax sp. RA8]|uniref:phage tail protein n=1 Tax=Variovorax sp. (strain JCM 16519 / RA8) TaxID=662548 RepID=UPI001316CAB5|nr:phage tail protein [Variovorax sp. RA8]VTU34095.1 Phage Tail Collar Domain protein [Variovorax sp. RA8]